MNINLRKNDDRIMMIINISSLLLFKNQIKTKTISTKENIHISYKDKSPEN